MRGTTTRKLSIALALVAALVAVQLVVPPLLREPLARWAEQVADAQLQGYRLSVGAVDLDPLGLGAQLRDLSLQEDDASEPPLLRVPEVDAGIALSGFFRFHTRMTVQNASIELDPARLRAVLKADLGRQLLTLGRDAVEMLAELRTALGTIDVEAASVRWVSPEGDLTLPAVEAHIGNASGEEAGGVDDRYTVRFEAQPPQSGTIRAHGESALFASEPPPMDLSFELDGLQLAWLAPLAERARLDVRSGVSSARGRVHLGEDRSLRIDLAEASLDDADIDWRHTAPTWAAERQALKEATGRLRGLLEGWQLAFAAQQVAVRRSTFGVQDASAHPPYRVFVTVESADVREVDSASHDGPATLTVEGRPMGTGRVDVEGRFRTAAGGPDVDLGVAVRDVELPALNDALVAHGAIPLASGRFSLELKTSVRDGRISGYAIPLLENVEVREKGDAGFARRVVETTVDAVTTLLEGERGDIATRTTLSGTLPSPEISIWEAVIGLLRNAFVEGIAPEFERAVGGD